MSTALLQGRVDRLCIGNTPDTHISTEVQRLEFSVWGIQGDKHHGHRRRLTVRDSGAISAGFTKGRDVFNTRQWSAISIEDMKYLAEKMDIPEVPPGLLGENIVFSGIPEFSLLPAGTQFFFKDSRDVLRKTILFVSEENLPCHVPAQAIQNAFPEKSGLKTSFARYAKNHRGLVGFVFATGIIECGDTVIAHIPTQHLPM